MLEVKFKRFKKRVRRRTGELKEAVESSDDEDTDNESRRHRSRQVTEAVRQPLQETSNGSGFNAASDLAYDSTASSLSSVHVPDISDEDRVPTPTEEVVRQSGHHLERWHSLQNLMPQTSTQTYNAGHQEMRHLVHVMPPSHFAAQQSVNDTGHQEMRRHAMPPLYFAAQQSANDAGHQEMRHHVMPPSHFAVQQSADDEPDIGKQEVFSPSNTSCTPNPSLLSKNGDSEKSGGVVQRFFNYFSKDAQTISESKSSTENSVGQLQNAGTSSSHRNIAGSSRRSTTPQGKAEASKAKNKPGGNRQIDTSVDKPSIESASEKPKPKSGEKPQPPPQSKTGGKAASSSGRTRSRYQVKYDQLHHPQ